jgi:HSP20 family protein
MSTNNGFSLWRDPWSPVSDLRREFDRFLEDGILPSSRDLSAEQNFAPACDVEEADDHFLLTVEMAGIKKEANYQDGILRVVVPKAESARPRRIKITHGSAGSKFFERLLGPPKESKNDLASPPAHDVAVAS